MRRATCCATLRRQGQGRPAGGRHPGLCYTAAMSSPDRPRSDLGTACATGPDRADAQAPVPTSPHPDPAPAAGPSTAPARASDVPASRRDNLFAALPAPATGEVCDDLLRWRQLRIERIVSSPHPPPTRYDQPQDEWVVLLQGEATLDLDGSTRHLVAGDHLFIPAHTPHQVLACSAEPRCLWLAVHLFPSPPSPATDLPP